MNRIIVDRMRGLSTWASAHVFPTRVLLVFGHLFLVTIALVAGMSMAPLPTLPLGGLQLFLLLAAVIITGIYTVRKRRGAFSWGSRKKLEGALLVCGLGLMALLHNGDLQRSTPIVPAFTQAHAVLTTSERQPARENKVRKFLHKIARKYVEWSLATKIVISILALLAIVVAGSGIVAIGCSLACEGMEVLAWLVIILGLGGLLTGGVFFYMWLYRSKEQQEARDARRAQKRAEKQAGKSSSELP